MNTKHTPGPWTFNMDGYIHSNDPSHLIIGKVHEHGQGKNVRHANAALIAAAPDLLSACKEALLALCSINETVEGPNAMPTQIEQRLEDAIAKADGR